MINSAEDTLLDQFTRSLKAYLKFLPLHVDFNLTEDEITLTFLNKDKTINKKLLKTPLAFSDTHNLIFSVKELITPYLPVMSLTQIKIEAYSPEELNTLVVEKSLDVTEALTLKKEIKLTTLFRIEKIFLNKREVIISNLTNNVKSLFSITEEVKAELLDLESYPFNPEYIGESFFKTSRKLKDLIKE